MIDLATAKRAAAAFLTEHVLPSAPGAVLLLDRLREHDDYWEFPYQDSEFLRTGNPSFLLAGNIPIRVQKADGATYFGPSYGEWLAEQGLSQVTLPDAD